MEYYVIVELHNGLVNSVRGPYMSDMEAFDHKDKCVAFRKANPVPLSIEFKIMKANHPDYIG